jgi:hypothetical protein
VGLPEQQVQPELILRGQLRDLDLETLLSALRLGRQYLTLDVFDAAGAHAGSVSVKSGRVIAAHAGEHTGAAALQQLLEQRDAAEFRVLLQPSNASIDAEPLGTIVELARGHVLDARTLEVIGEHDHEDYVDEEATSTRTRIVQGVLSDSLTLDDVLRVVAVTRQHVSVELSGPDGLAIGQARTKAGKILSASAGELSELAALQRLLAEAKLRAQARQVRTGIARRHLRRCRARAETRMLRRRLVSSRAAWTSSSSRTCSES